jgi:hypothetical protein
MHEYLSQYWLNVKMSFIQKKRSLAGIVRRAQSVRLIARARAIVHYTAYPDSYGPGEISSNDQVVAHIFEQYWEYFLRQLHLLEQLAILATQFLLKTTKRVLNYHEVDT